MKKEKPQKKEKTIKAKKPEKKKEMVSDKAETKKETIKQKIEKKAKIAKPKEIKKIQQLLKKKWKPVFRGRFGKRSIRRKSKAKWNKWRNAKGLDIQRRKEDGRIVDSGYRTPKGIRFLHPSGYREIMVRNLNDLNNVQKNEAIRLSAKLGAFKRKIIVQKANEKGIMVLNR